MKRKSTGNKSDAFWAKSIFEQEGLHDSNDQKVHYSKLNKSEQAAPNKENASWSEHLFHSLDKNHLKRCEKLVISINGDIIHEIEFRRRNAEYVIGRDPLSDIQIESPKVEEFHARVSCRNWEFFIEDLDSEHGTYIDGKRLKDHEVKKIEDRSRVRIMGFQIDFYLNPYAESEKKIRAPGSENTDIQLLKSKRKQSDPLLSDLIVNREKTKTWEEGAKELVVVDVIDETPDVKTFRLTGVTPVVFSYHPGQFVTLILSINGQQVRRSYSMSSSPSRPYTLDLTVKRVADGLVSNWLCDVIKPGDTLKVKGPSGKFSCFNQSPEKLLLIGAGSGITPVMSMARWIVDTGSQVDTKLLASFHSRKDIIFQNELDSMRSRSGNMSVGITVSAERNVKGKRKGKGKADWPGFTGRINKKILQNFAPDIKERHIFLCGPESFMDSVNEILGTMNFPMNNLHCESFATGHIATNTEYELQRKIVSEDAKYQVTFVKAGLTVPGNDKFNLLELAEMHGIEMDFSCRIGHCGECMVKCLAGQVEMNEQAEIEEQEKQDRWVFGCCAYPRSDILIDS